MLKNYELLYILHPDLEGTSDKVAEKVTKFITQLGGEIVGQEDWGKRKLAYSIAKNDFGVYILVNFTLPSGKLPEVERDLRLSEEVIRFMIVALPEEKEAKPTRKARAAERAEKSAKAEVKESKKEETVVEEAPAEEKPKAKAKATAKKETKKVEKKPAKEDDKKTTEAERMKKLDEKLEEILGE